MNFMRMVLSRFFHQNLFAFAKSISTRFSCKPFCMQSVSLEPFCLYSVVAEAGHVQTRHLQQMTCSDVIGRNDAQSKALDPLGSGLDTTGRSVGEKDAGWIAVVLYELIFRLYNFSALVPQSYVAQWVDLLSIASWLCYATYRLC